MKSRINPLLLCLLVAGLFAAIPSHAAPAPESKSDKDRQALEQQLEQAQAQLDSAAQQVAKLSAELGRDRVFETKDFQFSTRGGARLGLIVMGTDQANTDAGVLVQAVTPGGPADKAGIKAGDILLSIAGHDLKGGADARPLEKLTDYLGSVKPPAKGAKAPTAKVRLRRDGTERTLEVTLDSFRPHTVTVDIDRDIRRGLEGVGAAIAPMAPGWFSSFVHGWGGMQLVSVTPGLGEYFGTKEGLLVIHAPDDNPFKLRDGDVILSIGGRTPQSPTHAMRILRSYAPGESVSLKIMRHRSRETLKATLPKADVPEAAPAPPAPAAPAPRATL